MENNMTVNNAREKEMDQKLKEYLDAHGIQYEDLKEIIELVDPMVRVPMLRMLIREEKSRQQLVIAQKRDDLEIAMKYQEGLEEMEKFSANVIK